MQILKIYLTAILVTGLTLSSFAQGYRNDPDQSTMTIAGTSTLHDWVSDVNTIDASAQITMNGQEVTAIEGLKVTIPVKSIKSGKGGMDKNTYKAMKESNFPNVEFSLSSIEKSGAKKLKCKGNLTIAGKTNSVEMDVSYNTSGNAVTFSSSIELKMTDYNIDPPTAMMGTIKTGDAITINYSIAFTQ